ncbi:hypothetical protein Dimus_033265 [Dionaea muscipula]
MCEFVGEILTIVELISVIRGKRCASILIFVLLDADWGSRIVKDEQALCLDASSYGNVARFINHRCYDANLVHIPVEVDTTNHLYYRVAFFTARNVDALEELTWSVKLLSIVPSIINFLYECRSPVCSTQTSLECYTYRIWWTYDKLLLDMLSFDMDGIMELILTTTIIISKPSIVFAASFCENMKRSNTVVKDTFLPAAIRKCGGNAEKGKLVYTAYGSSGQVCSSVDAVAKLTYSGCDRTFIIFCSNNTHNVSGMFVENANAADIIQRRQRSEFLCKFLQHLPCLSTTAQQNLVLHFTCL